MDSFGELWSHHPAILPSAPSDGKSRFVPHGVPERHLDRQEPQQPRSCGHEEHIHAHRHRGERGTLAYGGKPAGAVSLRIEKNVEMIQKNMRMGVEN